MAFLKVFVKVNSGSAENARRMLMRGRGSWYAKESFSFCRCEQKKQKTARIREDLIATVKKVLQLMMMLKS